MNVIECYDQVMKDSVSAHKGAWHEWATLKAYLCDAPKIEAIETFRQLFDMELANDTKSPKWLIQLACEWKGAELGHARTKKRWEGIDASTLAVVRQLDEKTIVYNSKVHKHLRHSDPELVA